MEQTKYIPGDLIIYTSLMKEPVAEIIEVRETSYLIRFMNRNFARVSEKEIKPIPLTPDILKKNGWKYTKISTDIFQYYKDDMYIRYDRLNKKFTFEDFYWSAKIIDIPYVHTFQHILFGLGLDSRLKV